MPAMSHDDDLQKLELARANLALALALARVDLLESILRKLRHQVDYVQSERHHQGKTILQQPYLAGWDTHDQADLSPAEERLWREVQGYEPLDPTPDSTVFYRP